MSKYVFCPYDCSEVNQWECSNNCETCRYFRRDSFEPESSKKDLKDYTDSELIQELMNRGSEVTEEYMGLLDHRQFCFDYAVGVPFDDEYYTERGVSTESTFNTLAEAKKFMMHSNKNLHAKLFKRIFLEVD